jgi:hypothetical protein
MFVQGRGAGASRIVPRRRATLVGAYPIVVVYRQGVERAGSVSIRKPVDHKVHPTQGAAQVTVAAACCPATAYRGTTCPKAVLTPWLTYR